MTPSQTVVQSISILGKRKASQRSKSLVIHLSSDAGSSYEELESDHSNTPKPSTSRSAVMMVNGTLQMCPKRRYQCTFEGCEKAYTKPSRLEEHERSHTGLRPFVCETCHKSYLRESHLHAHARSHLPESERPFLCDSGSCRKRFWTSQHLQAHLQLHTGEKPFKCSEVDCEEAFAKHHQLRTHMCTVHAPPGTKPYQCSHADCSKSFSTSQKLRAHAKTHDDKRYMCAHPNCLSPTSTPRYFSTWTALQHHTRVDHPPTCTHPSCNGRLFTSQKGLRAHQMLHEERDAEARLGAEVHNDSDAEDSDSEAPPRKKRRGGELGRDWKCDVDTCDKSFKSKKAMTTHIKVNHQGRRDFVCPHSACKRAFGYKHLLQRHLAKIHKASGDSTSSEAEETEADGHARAHESDVLLDIDAVTGNSYSKRAAEKVETAKALRCPHPHLQGLGLLDTALATILESESSCEYVFSRAYDLRRHLRANHGIELEKDVVDKWVLKQKTTSRNILQ
ncbi:Strongly-conserved Zn-finger binding protein (TFIIIA) [Pleurotus ostreatus]|uniref:Strongly-conserved Zn-finger binding protein (TFIIIA) n=1 Tax=Pleurotus ostreatus TaxID=5322 RepID=A0A8H7DT30_PLEOS|nr:Strongly-conserved Zn-finger binding protein (TFIIIA) [Pleurotus ostreatus]KAF7428555.1 Strongly-conserved Zn-finger binding protein (TFIIIA) [Pleurotus ostreatus]